MEGLALSVSKSIAEYLEQNEKRFQAQSTHQNSHEQTINQLNSRLDELEQKCEKLHGENASLKTDLETVRKVADDNFKELITTKSDLERMQKQVNECNEWVKLITALTSQVHNLNETRNATEKELKSIHKNQIELNKVLEKQQRQLKATAATAQAAAAATSSSYRAPTRSPSSSSFFNGNHCHSPMPRFKSNPTPNHHYHNKDEYYGSADHNDEISEMSENAECLLKEVQALNDLQRSFERNSICSED